VDVSFERRREARCGRRTAIDVPGRPRATQDKPLKRVTLPFSPLPLPPNPHPSASSRALIWGYIWVFATAVHYRNLWWSRRTKGVFPILLFLLFCSSIMIVVTAGFTSIMGLYNGAIVVAVAIFLLLIFVIVIGHTSAELHCNRRIVRDGYYLTIVMVISLSLPNMCGRMLYMMRTGVTNGVLMVVIWQVLMVLCFSMVRITINRATTPFHSAHLVFFMVLTIDT